MAVEIIPPDQWVKRKNGLAFIASSPWEDGCAINSTDLMSAVDESRMSPDSIAEKPVVVLAVGGAELTLANADSIKNKPRFLNTPSLLRWLEGT
jgi:hypothetical protein